MICYNCNQSGHVVYHCPYVQRGDNLLQYGMVLTQSDQVEQLVDNHNIYPNWILIDICSTAIICCNNKLSSIITDCYDRDKLIIKTNGGLQHYEKHIYFTLLPLKVHLKCIHYQIFWLSNMYVHAYVGK